MGYINAISYYFPEDFISNQDIIKDYQVFAKQKEKRITADELYQQNWIRKRYQAKLSVTAKDLGNYAAKKIFLEWDIDKDDVEYIIFVSDALEYKGPTTACIIQNDLGLKTTVGAIDILHGCTGFVYGLSIANALIVSGQVNNVLLITADTPTKIIHPSDIELRSIFSDAGAATLVSNQKIKEGINASLGKFTFGTDGSGEHLLKVERSGTRHPADVEWLRQFLNDRHNNLGGRLIMKSSAIFLFALRTVPRLVKKLLEIENLSQNDISFFILHQANGQMLDFIRKRMKIPSEQFIVNIEEIGNTVSASIPIALCDAFRENKFSQGDKVLLAGFGIGLSWGGTIINFE
ncbi:3-oxoacyl-ACP synthase III family protein [Mesonia aquimarina]|uniref:3-oxoacyl-ACP synthase III family protein n=1 Tax=Mesonia aquimarina TaxID=1504967 RepID=UPI000EF631F2|nr:ketoacyl-ACP synthase III [Mesonia aquimarina]